MKLGVFGARADNTGLGVQTWEFCNHMPVDKTLVVDLSVINAQKGKRTQNYYERFNDPIIVQGFPLGGDVDNFLNGLDTVICFETPYNYYLFDACRRRGIKTALQYNYEFLDYLQHDSYPLPDLLLAPSKWHLKDVEAMQLSCELKYLPVPINRQNLPFKEKTEARTFLHIAGHNTFEDRNGTQIVLDAVQYIQSDIKLVIKSQRPIPYHPALEDRRVEVQYNDYKNYWSIYDNEDVLVLPRRYGGLSLQLNESLSCGMIPLMPSVPPQSYFLDNQSLMETFSTKKIMTRTAIDCVSVRPITLATHIDKLANSTTRNIQTLSHHSNKIAGEWAWETMKTAYIETLEALNISK